MEQDTQNTALLAMDMQAGIISRLADATSPIANAAKAIAHARNKKIPVIYVTVGFRQGAPEVSMNNKSFAAGIAGFSTMDMGAFMKIHPEVAPLENEITVVKRRFSAFTGSDLEVILRSWNIQHIILMGFSTSGVVLSTTREAADKDYRITILADCCGDGDDEVHRILTTKVFPRQAEVITADEWIKK